MAFDVNAAKQAGYSDQEIQQYLARQQAPNPDEGKITQALSGTGLFNIPVLGGILRSVAQPIASGVETVAQAAAPNQFYKPGNTIVSDNEARGLGIGSNASFLDATKQGVGTGLGVDAALSSAKGISELPTVIKSLPDLLGYLTKGGVGAKIGNKVASSTASGATDSWNDFQSEVKQAVQQRLGKGQNYQDILNSRLAPEAPASLDQSPQITANDLQGFRQQAANREPQGIFAKFQGKSPEDQVDEIIRQVSSSRLKDLAGTGNLDKLYSIYSKFGSPASIAGRAALGAGVSAVVPDQYKTQAAGGVTGAAELLKILGIL